MTTVYPSFSPDNAQSTVKLLGLPGTGKTTKSVLLVEEYGVLDEQLCAETFRKPLALDMKEKLGRDSTPWVSTTHGICWRLLLNNMDDKREVIEEKDRKAFCNKINIPYRSNFYRKVQPEVDYETGSLGETLFSTYGFLIANLFPTEEWRVAPGMSRHTGVTDELVSRFFNNWEEYKSIEQKIDFPDMLKDVHELGLSPEAEVYLSDEFQDKTPIQLALFNEWSKDANFVIAAGDPYQCVVRGTRILVNTTSELETSKSSYVPIEEIVPGDTIVSASGRGTTSLVEVLNVYKQTAEKELIEITLEDGEKLTTTKEHQMFVHVPINQHFTHLGGTWFYVYLMYNSVFGYRIGITNNLGIRLRQEAHADFILPIKSCVSEEDARFYEELYSLRYGIPTIMFQARSADTNKRKKEQKLIEKLFHAIDTRIGAQAVCEALDIDLRFPVLTSQGVGRDVINVELCQRRNWDTYEGKKRGKTAASLSGMFHIVTFYTSDPHLIKRIEKEGIKTIKGKKQGRRVKKQSKNLGEILTFTKNLGKIIGNPGVKMFARFGILEREEAAFHKYLPCYIVPARNVLKGMYLPTYDEERGIIYKRVEKVERHEKNLVEVYDLDIDTTHNYIANNIVVHNCIYDFWGTDPEYFNELPGDLEILPKSYRLHRAVWEMGKATLTQVGYNVPELETKEGGQVSIITTRNQLEALIQEHRYQPKFFLVRANYMGRKFSSFLDDLGIPFSGIGGWNRKQIEIYNALLKLTAHKLDYMPLAYATGPALSADELKALTEFFRASLFVVAKTGIQDLEGMVSASTVSQTVKPDLYKIAKTGFIPQAGLLAKYSNAYRQRIQNALKHHQKLIVERPLSYVGTIHSSKGLETDIVFLFDNITHRIREAMLQDGKSEARVFFTGMTRPRKELIIVHDYFKTLTYPIGRKEVE